MREREEIIIGNPGFAKHRDEVIRQRIEAERNKRLGVDNHATTKNEGLTTSPLIKFLLVVSILGNGITFYALQNEIAERQRVDAKIGSNINHLYDNDQLLLGEIKKVIKK